MHLKHKVHVNVDTDGRETPVVSCGEMAIRRRRLKKFLMGDKVNILVVTPEESTRSVEIHEIGKGGEEGEDNRGEAQSSDQGRGLRS